MPICELSPRKMKSQHHSKILSLVAFTDLVAVSLVVPLVGAHLRTLGISHFLIGLLGSLYAALQLISSPVIGSWSDVRGHRLILTYTMIICSICYMIWGFTSSFTIIFLIRFVLGTFKHTQTLCKALIADSVPHSKHSEAYGTFNAISGVGFMIGPAIGGHLAEMDNGFSYVCCIVAFTFWINTALVYFCIPEKIERNNTEGRKNKVRVKEENSLWIQLMTSFHLLKSIEWINFWDVFTLKFLLGFSQAVFYSNYGLYIQESFGVGPRWLGYTISLQGMVGSVSSYFIGYLGLLYQNDPTYNVRMLHGFIILTLSFCVLGLAPSLNYFIIGLIPLSASGALLRVVGMEAVLQRTDVDKRGSLMGSSNSISSVARLVAPVCAGLIHDLAGAQGIFTLTQFVSGGGIVLASYLLFKGEHKKRQ